MAGIRQNTFFVSIGQFLRIFMAFILLPISSRALGDASFGRYSLATTIMFFVMLVDDFGLNMWVTREIAKHRERAQRYFAYTVGLKAALILVSGIFLTLLLYFTHYDRETVSAVWIFALYGIICSFRDLAVALFRAFEEMGWESLALSIEKVLTTVLGIAVLMSGGRLIALAWAFVISAALSLAYSAYVLFARFVKPDWAFSIREFFPMLKGAGVFGLSLFLTTMYGRVDMVMLSVMKGPQVWGWYSAAHKLVDFTNVVPTILMIATFPAFSRYSSSASTELNALFTRGFKYLLLLGIPLIPGVMLLAKPMILTIYGSQYINAVPSLRLFGWTAAILFVNIFAAGLYGATNHQGKLAIIQVIGLILNVSFNLFLIPKLAHVGAALSTVLTEAIVLLITLTFAFRKIVRLTEKRFMADILLATVLMSGLILPLRQADVFVVVLVAMTVYFGVLFLRKTIRIEELLQFKKKKVVAS